MIGHRSAGVVPLLAGRQWDLAARDLQEYLERLLHAIEGMPSDEVLGQISDVVQTDAGSAGATRDSLIWALLLFDKG